MSSCRLEPPPASIAKCVCVCFTEYVRSLLLLQGAALHPLLLALRLLTLVADPLLPEGLDAEPVVDQSQVHLSVQPEPTRLEGSRSLSNLTVVAHDCAIPYLLTEVISL